MTFEEFEKKIAEFAGNMDYSIVFVKVNYAYDRERKHVKAGHWQVDIGMKYDDYIQGATFEEVLAKLKEGE